MSLLLCMAFGYAMGSINSAIIVCRLFSLPDPRTEGSKNPGATNVLRLAGKQYASFVLVIDVLKGFIPVFMISLLGAPELILSFTALAAVLGHIYPVFFGFRGGKGVATAMGTFFGLHVLLGTLAALTWLVVAKLSRHSSLASIVSLCLAPFYSLVLLGTSNAFPALMVMALVILYKHHANIARLIQGTEDKIKWKSSALQEIIPPAAPPSPAPEHEQIVKPKPLTPKPIPPKAEKKPAKPAVKKTKKTPKPKSPSP